jgi:hypothetical protein
VIHAGSDRPRGGLLPTLFGLSMHRVGCRFRHVVRFDQANESQSYPQSGSSDFSGLLNEHAARIGLTHPAGCRLPSAKRPRRTLSVAGLRTVRTGEWGDKP